MHTIPSIFAFDPYNLSLDGIERCFEMNKAENYALKAGEHMSRDSYFMFWIFGEDTCPEMQMALKKAKKDYGHLWPQECSEGSMAELIFQIVALEKLIWEISEDNNKLKDENTRLTSLLHKGLSKPLEVPADGLVATLPEVSMQSAYDEASSPYYNPVPGINTILSCAERKDPIDTGPTPTLTVNVRQKMDQIRQMFCEGDSEQHQETLNAAVPAVDKMCCVPTVKPSSLYPQKDVPDEMHHGHRMGLQIFKDPEGLAARDNESKRQRQPLRTFASHFPPPGDENLGVVTTAVPKVSREPAQVDLAETTACNFTLPIVFDPPCASTAVFTRRPAFSPSTSPSPDVEIEQNRPKLQKESAGMEMDLSNSPTSPRRSSTLLADAFNQFVHSPDQSGKLRIDATKFIDVFLSKKSTKSKDSENRRPPLF